MSQYSEKDTLHNLSFLEHNQLCPVHQGHHIVRKMVAAHPFGKEVEDKLHGIVLAHQLDKLKMEQQLQADREPLGGHQDLEMYMTHYFSVLVYLLVIQLFRIFLPHVENPSAHHHQYKSLPLLVYYASILYL
jgi:hypothetical protein